MRPLTALILDRFYSLQEGYEKATTLLLVIRISSSLVRYCKF